MLRALGVSELSLLSNNLDKADQLARLGITVASRVPTGVHLSATNAAYLRAKARSGHRLDRAVLLPAGPEGARDRSA
jgi:GTP cyclohydrolase II